MPPYATAIVEPFHVPELIVPNALTLLEPSKLTDLLEGYVTNTLTTPENVTAVLELLEDRMVVRVNVGPVVE